MGTEQCFRGFVFCPYGLCVVLSWHADTKAAGMSVGGTSIASNIVYSLGSAWTDVPAAAQQYRLVHPLPWPSTSVLLPHVELTEIYHIYNIIII
eukprot:COSAG05_NODE_478_length_9434_cov_5.178897_9_plen_94_part_00